jgi:hypothetical protein
MMWNGSGRHPPLAFVGDERSQIVRLLQCFPNTWEGVVKKSTFINHRTGQRFWQVLTITSARTRNYYQVFFDRGMRGAQMFFHDIDKDPHWRFRPIDSQGMTYSRVGPTLKIKPSQLPPIAFEDSHPIRRLANWVFDMRHCACVDASFKLLFPGEIVNHLLHRQDREATSSNPIESLHRLNKGLFKVYESTQPSTPMQRLGSGKYLYGLTYIFPHAVQLLKSRLGNCVMLDATFKAMKPYVLSILHLIIRGESIPIALAVFPAENLDGYTRLYKDLIAVVERNGGVRNLLTGLPLVSDQGAALKALAVTFSLQWKLCHRHLIENAGASSPHGDWVRRILECCTQLECRRAIAVIWREFQLLPEEKRAEYQKSSNLSLLKRMISAFHWQCDRNVPVDWLGAMPHPFEPLPVQWWARWLRPGCPTTSNSAESIHSWLNKNNQEVANAGFFARLDVVIAQLFLRIDKRDMVKRVGDRYLQRIARALRAKGSWPPLPNSPDFALWEFNLRIGYACGDQSPQFAWQYPPFGEGIRPDVKVVPADGHPPLPLSWAPVQEDREARSRAAYLGLLQLDYPSHREPFQLDKQDAEDDPIPDEALRKVPHINPWYTSAGWAIVRAVRCLTPQATWKSANNGWAAVIPLVFNIGHELGCAIPTGRLSEDQEGGWRSRVFRELGLY